MSLFINFIVLQFVDVLALIVNSSPSNEKQLNIILPSKQRVSLTFKKRYMYVMIN